MDVTAIFPISNQNASTWCRTRRWLSAILIASVAGCADLPAGHSGVQDGRDLLQQAASAHGIEAFKTLHDVNVAYAGFWSSLIKHIQPVLIDEGYRGGSEERLLVSSLDIGQTHRGPSGTKTVFRTADTIRVWRNGVVDNDSESLDSAALVADDYRVFLLGPMLLVKLASTVERVGTDVVNDIPCDLLLVTLKPGLGHSSGDSIELYLDHQSHLLKRLRFSLEGLESTRGAVAQVDLSDYVVLHGVAWPTHFVESLKKPIPGLSIHDWHLTGIDFDRGYSVSDIDGVAFEGAAKPAAGRWQPSP